MLKDAREAGVGLIIQSGMDLATSRYSVQLSEEFPEIYATVGLHPLEAGNNPLDQMAGIAPLAAHPRVVGLGETGLDFHHENWPYPVQADVFARHIELAHEYELPLVIHTRDAEERTLALLDKHAAGLTVILHCFSMTAYLSELVERGYYISFAGNVTYKNAPELQEAAQALPDHLLLLETDAPWLSPVPLRGRPNHPALVAHTYEFVAALRKIDVEALSAQVEANVRRAFPRLGA